MNPEKVFDKEQWKKEAEAVIKDIECGVKEARIAHNLCSSDSCIYLNVTIIENSKFCIELSKFGFRIVGRNHDCNTDADANHYETPYSLLNHLSAAFREQFGKSLVAKLQAVEDLENGCRLHRQNDFNAEGK